MKLSLTQQEILDKMDKHGYPEDHELDKIKSWPYDDPLGLIWYIEDLWKYEEYFSFDDNNLELHTGGWSGNEDIIEALQSTMFWKFYWVISRRGGHYFFKLKR